MRSGKHSATFFTITDAKLYPEVYTVDLSSTAENLAQFHFSGIFVYLREKKKKRHTELCYFVTM